MSRNQINNTKTSTNNKPYCKVCHDAGKTEKEYTSHFVKSQDRKTGTTIVTCPTLLNTECRYCYQLGHTSKFCTTALSNKKRTEAYYAREEFVKVQKEKQVEVKNNRAGGFNALLDLNDEPFEPAIKKMKLATTFLKAEDFPSLGEPSKRVNVVSNYAAAAAFQPLPMIQKQQQLPSNFQVLQKDSVYEKTPEIKREPLIRREPFKNFRITNWADDTTDDESDNDEEVYVDNTAW